MKTEKIEVYRFIAPNGKMYGHSMVYGEAFRKLQFMRNEISGIDIISVGQIDITKKTKLYLVKGKGA